MSAANRAGSSAGAGSVPTVAAAVLDAAAVLLFAAVGRRSHAEGLAVLGVLRTAWPFLAGVAVGWAVARARHAPADALAAGVPVWAGALVVGMVLRVVTGAGTAVSFVVVAGIVLAVLLLGWRLVARAVTSRRTPEAAGRRP